MAITINTPYSVAPNVGRGFYSALDAPGTFGFITVSPVTGGTLVVQRYGHPVFQLPLTAGVTYTLEVNDIQTIGILAGAVAATGNFVLNTAG